MSFIFEIIGNSWRKLKLKEKKKLLEHGAFDPKRMGYVHCVKLLYQHPTKIQMILDANLFMHHGHALLNSMNVVHSCSRETDIIKTTQVFKEGGIMRQEQLLTEMLTQFLKMCMNS